MNGFLDLSNYLSDVSSDVLNGYVGYHSWEVTVGQVAASDFYVVNIVFVHEYNAVLTYRQALLRAGIGESTGSRVCETVVFHPLLAGLQASPEIENSHLDWRHNLYLVLRFDFCA